LAQAAEKTRCLRSQHASVTKPFTDPAVCTTAHGRQSHPFDNSSSAARSFTIKAMN
jgi:hypothetical protein